MTEIVIPYKPRPLQAELHDALEKYRWGVVVCHRRFGKSVAIINHLIRAALTHKMKNPRFAYIAPTYKQAKSSKQLSSNQYNFLSHIFLFFPQAKNRINIAGK